MEIITLIGPTATGKTAVAARLSFLLGTAPILSGDSRQVYRGMDIGTGKDLSEYIVESVPIPYYLIDIAEPGERYNIHRYLRDAHAVLSRLPVRPTPILCGGSGLYVEALRKGYALSGTSEDRALRSRLEILPLEALQKEWYRLKKEDEADLDDPKNPRRLIRAIEQKTAPRAEGTVYPPLSGPVFYLDVPREVRRERITRRLKARLEEGMIDEVKRLLERIGSPEPLIAYGLEYRFVTEYVLGKYGYEEMFKQLETAIHQFSKRQMTWIRGMERRGLELIPIKPSEDPFETARNILSSLD